MTKAEFSKRFHLIQDGLRTYKKDVLLGISALALVNVLEVAPPWILMLMVDAIVGKEPTGNLIKLAVLFLAVALVQAICRYLWRIYLIKSSMLAGADLRNRLAKHVIGLSHSFFDRSRIGDLMANMTNDVDAVRFAIGGGILTVADAAFFFLTVPIAMVFLSPSLTLIAFLPMLLLPIIVLTHERKIFDRFKKVQEGYAHLSAQAQESLSGMRVTRAFAKEGIQNERFAKTGIEFVSLNLRLARVQARFGPLLDFCVTLSIVLLLVFGGKMVLLGTLSVGTFVAFYRYIQKLAWPMSALGLAMTFFERAAASTERIDKVLSEQTEIRSLPKIKSIEAGFSRGPSLEIKNLTFSYPGTTKTVLKNISLSLPSGGKLGIFGQIGSGKSTLLSLIPRLYQVEDEKIFLNGVDINKYSISSLRGSIGFVSQDIFLFNSKVIENVTLGDSDGSAWQESVQFAQIHDEIVRLPLGYETRIGERGSLLSGGQKQRLTIARALSRKPKLLIFDDSLSAVDFVTESKILENLKSVDESMTVIIASHRRNIVSYCDVVITIQDGALSDSDSQVVPGKTEGQVLYE